MFTNSVSLYLWSVLIWGSTGCSFKVTLIGRIGADKTAYAAVLFPVIALGISTVFEDYQWTLRALFGFALVLLGTHRAESRPYPGVTTCRTDYISNSSEDGD